MKPVIIAICGAAASGKDTLLNALAPALGATKIISDTTRLPRVCEKQGVDYNFIDTAMFWWNIEHNYYLEWASFRGWYYGTHKDSVCGKVNIGVFNMDGILSLYQYKDMYEIIPIYLKVSVWTRIKRYINRDGKFTWECVRRLFADARQFFFTESYLDAMYPQHLVLKNFKNDQNLNDLVQYLVCNPLSVYYQ